MTWRGPSAGPYAMVNVSIVMLMFFVIFGILGVQVFNGRFYRCTDPSAVDRGACTGFYYDAATGAPAQREWKNRYLNFDDLPNALVSLFVISTLDGTASHSSPFQLNSTLHALSLTKVGLNRILCVEPRLISVCYELCDGISQHDQDRGRPCNHWHVSLEGSGT